MHRKPLGCNKPPDRRHIELFPADKLETLPTNAPVIVGFTWYTNFDNPIKGSDGIYRVGKGSLGSVRGGHCFCFEPSTQPDQPSAWVFYDQGEEGACTGFGSSRAMTLMDSTKRTFDAFWLYDDAQRNEGAYVPDGGSVDNGSTVRSAAQALVKWGDHFELGEHCVRESWHTGAPGEGIKSFHWLTSAEQFREALGYPPTVEEFDFLNSWGEGGYPHRVRMPAAVIDRLLKEEGEAAIFIR